MAYIFITKKEKTNWKYILIIVILALIVVGETLYLAKQEVKLPETKLPQKFIQDETADWKTYRNDEYGFEFKYPNQWGNVSNSPDAILYQSDSTVIFNPPEFEEQFLATGYPFLEIRIKENPRKLDVEDFYYPLVKEYETKEKFKENLMTRQIRDITYYQTPTSWGALLTIFPLNSAFLEFSHHTITLEAEKIFNQMLSTFRFIE